MSGDHNAHQSDFHPDLEIDSLILKDFGERYAADTALLRQALLLCEWIEESPHVRGSINGLAEQLKHAIGERLK